MIGLLSVPNWIIHISSVLEWALAMWLFWLVGKKTGNIWFKRMALAMLPYMLSGWCAIIYHIGYDEWAWLNDVQAYLTFTGSCCFTLWAFLLLRSVTARQKAVEAGRARKEARRG